MYAAGVIPFTFDVISGKTLFLIGLETRDNTFSDFGGKSESRDKSSSGRPCPIATASREFYEETLGLVMGQSTTKARINQQNAVVLLSSTLNKHRYFQFVIQIDFQPAAPVYFARAVAFLRARGMGKFVEKSSIKWVTFEELQELPQRQVFSHTLSLHHEFFKKLSMSQPQEWRGICFLNASRWGPSLALCSPAIQQQKGGEGEEEEEK